MIIKKHDNETTINNGGRVKSGGRALSIRVLNQYMYLPVYVHVWAYCNSKEDHI